KIAARLMVDGRESNRSLAAALNVNQATITARLRRMAAANQMHVTAVGDLGAFGLIHQAFVIVQTADRPASEVAKELALEPELMSVNLTSGAADVLVRVISKDPLRLAQVLGEVIPAVEGVQSVDAELAVELLHYSS